MKVEFRREYCGMGQRARPPKVIAPALTALVELHFRLKSR